MKIRFLQSVRYATPDGRQYATLPGEVADLSEALARKLISRDLAEIDYGKSTVEMKPAEPALETKPAEPDPELETKPARRKKRERDRLLD